MSCGATAMSSSGSRIVATVSRGFLTRFDERARWIEVLVALPEGTVPVDSDAVLYYRKGADGIFYEYPGDVPSSIEDPVYVPRRAVAEPIVLEADELFAHCSWLHLQSVVRRYLRSRAPRFYDDAEAEARLADIVCYYVAAIRGVPAEVVQSQHEEDFQLVRLQVQELTACVHKRYQLPFLPGTLDDYSSVARVFFDEFHSLALEALRN